MYMLCSSVSDLVIRICGRREISLLPLNRAKAFDARKKAILSQGWKLKVYDAVRIIGNVLVRVMQCMPEI